MRVQFTTGNRPEVSNWHPGKFILQPLSIPAFSQLKPKLSWAKWLHFCQAQSRSSFSFAEQTELALYLSNPPQSRKVYFSEEHKLDIKIWSELGTAQPQLVLLLSQLLHSQLKSHYQLSFLLPSQRFPYKLASYYQVYFLLQNLFLFKQLASYYKFGSYYLVSFFPIKQWSYYQAKFFLVYNQVSIPDLFSQRVTGLALYSSELSYEGVTGLKNTLSHLLSVMVSYQSRPKQCRNLFLITCKLTFYARRRVAQKDKIKYCALQHIRPLFVSFELAELNKLQEGVPEKSFSQILTYISKKT